MRCGACNVANLQIADILTPWAPSGLQLESAYDYNEDDEWDEDDANWNGEEEAAEGEGGGVRACRARLGERWWGHEL